MAGHIRLRSSGKRLALIVVVGGSALAGVVGLLLFAAGFFVEQAIG